MPEFATPLARQQAQLLMQPALIRVIDNIRKQLEGSRWQGTYEDQLIWPDSTTDEQQQQYKQLQQQTETASPELYDQLQLKLAQLPQPQHIYTLCLTKDNQEQRIDLWQLCYQVCCTNYDLTQPETPLEIDLSLFDETTQEVDWITLDQKAKRSVEMAFEVLS